MEILLARLFRTLLSPVHRMQSCATTQFNMNKQEILQKLQEGFDLILSTVEPQEDAVFFQRKNEKWSIAENIDHLRLSVKPLNMAFSLPNFTLLFFGTLNRPERTYDEMIAKYLSKLQEGVVAPPNFVPEGLAEEKDRAKILQDFNEVNQKFLEKIADYSEEDLGKYLIPHPVLGKLTIREMLYFTIYHTLHHHKAIVAI
jgi:DinB superfamily